MCLPALFGIVASSWPADGHCPVVGLGDSRAENANIPERDPCGDRMAIVLDNDVCDGGLVVSNSPAYGKSSNLKSSVFALSALISGISSISKRTSATFPLFTVDELKIRSAPSASESTTVSSEATLTSNPNLWARRSEIQPSAALSCPLPVISSALRPVTVLNDQLALAEP